MKKKQKRIQIVLVSVGIFLILITYFYYPYAKKIQSVQKQNSQNELANVPNVEHDTFFENV